MNENEQIETVVEDPYAGRRSGAFKGQQAVYTLFGVLEVLLIIRLALRGLGANAQAGFAQFIYGLTAPFVAPFQGLFPQAQNNANVFEPQSLLAIIVYALVAWLVVRLVWLAVGETRAATETTTTKSAHISK